MATDPSGHSRLPAAEAVYFDGRTSARRQVRVQLWPDRIDIRDAAGPVLAGPVLDRWSLDSLKINDLPDRSRGVRLARQQADGRLEIADPAFLRALYARTPQLRGGRSGADTHWRLIAALSAGTLVVVGGLYWLAASVAPAIAVAVVPRSLERDLGHTVSDVIVGDRECRDPAGMAALDRLRHRLAAHAPMPAEAFRVRVVDAAVPNALATFGGELVLFRGLIDAAGSSEEVAGVLAHEMGHAIERHALQGYVRGNAMSVLVMLISGGAWQVGAEVGATLTTLSYSRDGEREADHWALGMLEGAGIRTDGMAAFFANIPQRVIAARIAGLERDRARAEQDGDDTRVATVTRKLEIQRRRLRTLDADAPPEETDLPELRLPGMLSTHPDPQERAVAARARAGRGGPAMSDADWHALQQMCTDRDRNRD